jgi:isochorismate hydrolase
VIQLLFGKYDSQSAFVNIVVGAFAHVLVVHPLLDEFTVQVAKYAVHNACVLLALGALEHVFSLQVVSQRHVVPDAF